MNSRLALLLLALVVMFPTNGSVGIAQKTKEETHSYTRWEQSDDGLRRRIEMRGKAEFNDEYTDVINISQGGYIRFEEERDSQSRRYEVRRDVGGQLTRSYYLNGKAKTIDAEAKKWLAALVLDAVRQGGFDAERRVQTILRHQGVAGVLREIDQIKGDYAKRVYFEALIKNANLDTAALQDMLRQAAHQISSDYEQAQLLLGVAPQLVAKESAIGAFFEAVATIKSDYEHSRVLTALLKNNPPTRALLTQVANSTRSISSDYEKAEVLKRAAAVYLDEPALRITFFQTIDSIKSDYERRGVLTVMLKIKDLSAGVMMSLLESAASITSDYEKADFLMQASTAYTGDANLKSAFLKVVETIKSEYERGRVLSALLKNKQIG